MVRDAAMVEKTHRDRFTANTICVSVDVANVKPTLGQRLLFT